ncbi:MAG: chemotaxis protein CheW [Planctomycetes bacterium]|nr:chemotaxis protein CheW [Planctomycetota bacterium]
MTKSCQFCTFLLHDLYLGVEVERVQEVLRYQAMTRVPTASSVVEGLINLRGQIVTAIDLRRRLGLPEREPGRQPMNVVVRTEDGIVSLLVDEIGDVLEVEAATFEDPPATLRGRARDLIRGVHKLERRLLLMLDVERTLAFDASGEAAVASGRG